MIAMRPIEEGPENRPPDLFEDEYTIPGDQIFQAVSRAMCAACE